MSAKRLIACELEVRWRDLDAFNHVNNQQFLGYIEEARVRWFRQLIGDWSQTEVLPIVAAITMNYRRPIEWPETVRVELFAERVGGKSLTVGHRIVSSKDEGMVYGDGNTVLVWIDKAGQTVPLPAGILAACN
ncbi:MAG TPA: thioesterase family protein [Arenimonas sp.]|nr:thioesterase family protein [Arenimonas sp.]